MPNAARPSPEVAEFTTVLLERLRKGGFPKTTQGRDWAADRLVVRGASSPEPFRRLIPPAHCDIEKVAAGIFSIRVRSVPT